MAVRQSFQSYLSVRLTTWGICRPVQTCVLETPPPGPVSPQTCSNWTCFTLDPSSPATPTPRQTFYWKVFFHPVALKVKISKVNAKLQIRYFYYSCYSLCIHYDMKKTKLNCSLPNSWRLKEFHHQKFSAHEIELFFTMHLYQKVNKCTYFLNVPKKTVYDLCFSGWRLFKCMDCAKKYWGFGDANFCRSVFCRGFKLHKKNNTHFPLFCSFTSNL